jgi:hypothetical protein
VVIAVEGLTVAAGHLAVRPIVALIRRTPLNIPDHVLGIVSAALRQG